MARWFDNREAAISLRFDDSLESHVQTVIPALNRHGIKATFMVNPGLERYLKNREFWERKVPAMGHELGNHTMHHRGARTVQEAEQEIGEVSRLIWRLYPARSRLTVFASGGGHACLWGGRRWNSAGQEFKQLVARYDLIDLYDGNHPAFSFRANDADEYLVASVEEARRERKHQPFLFHKIGSPTVYERLKALYLGIETTSSEKRFLAFLDSLSRVRDRIWVAPLTQILKYEHEYRHARIVPVKKGVKFSDYRLKVATGTLYDQELTILVPMESSGGVTIYQDLTPITTHAVENRNLRFNVKPVDSIIRIVHTGTLH